MAVRPGAPGAPGDLVKLDASSKLPAVDGSQLTNVSLSAASSSFAFTGINSPAQITADQNDYNPASLATANTLRLSTDALRTITGLAGGAVGRVMIVTNIGSFPLVLAHENAGSTAANRFTFDTYDLVVAAGQAITLQYDSTSSRWRPLSANNLSRSGGAISYNGTISPAQITAQQDNYNPTGLSTATILRINSDAARTITGIAGGSDGRILVVINTGTKAITLANDVTSTAANRFLFDGSDLALAGGCAVILWYDTTSSRWRCIGQAMKVSTTDDQGTTTITNSLTTDQLATGMTRTPKAGIYFVLFTGMFGNSNNGASVFASIWMGGAQVAGTERQYLSPQANSRTAFAAGARTTVDGTQAIEGRWRVSANTGTMIGRSLTILEVTT